MKRMSLLLLVASIGLCACANPKETSTLQQLKALSGTYMDAQPYAYGTAYGQRIFTFEQGKWTLKFTLSLAPDLSQPVFEFRTLGTYEVTAPSSAVEGAFEAAFSEDQKFVTLLTADPQLIDAFGFTPCNLTPNVEQNISSTGCAAWKSVAECPIDYDLLYLDEAGLLYFGARPADNNMCTPDRRPTSLTPGVSKQ